MSASSSRGSVASALTFRSPEPTEFDPDNGLPMGEGSPSPSPSLHSIPSPSSSPEDVSPSVSDASSDASSGDDASDLSSSSASSGSTREKVSAVSQKAQREAARKAVRMAGAAAHQYLARDAAARAAQLYLIDDDTAAAIADPLARIAARHAPVDSAVNNPDVADGIAAMMGVADFVRQTIERQSHAAYLRANGYTEPAPVVDEHQGDAA